MSNKGNFDKGYKAGIQEKSHSHGTEDMTNKELFDLIKHEKEVQQRANSAEHVNIEKRIMALLVAQSARDLHRTEELIREHYSGHKEDFKKLLPAEHVIDHEAVKFLRESSSKFMGGVFGALGKIVLILILIGLGLQVISVGDIIK